jgi:tRNA synthetases class I (E and Q), anti-codon binding domain
LHLRSSYACGQCAGRAEGKVDHSLGVGGACGGCRNPLIRNLVRAGEPADENEGKDLTECLNPKSLEVLKTAKLEPSLRGAAVGSRYQFERLGYFCVDPDSIPEKPAFNRTVALRDSWGKIEKNLKLSVS